LPSERGRRERQNGKSLENEIGMLSNLQNLAKKGAEMEKELY
jgi:hypothetical protein